MNRKNPKRHSERNALRQWVRRRMPGYTPHRRDKKKELAKMRAARYPLPTRPCPQCCELCEKPFTATPHLDHDHFTGLFRGWLCRYCNTGIGMLQDCPRLLERAKQYVLQALL